MNKKIKWLVGIILLIVIVYYLLQMYVFAQGVIEDTERIESFEQPKEIKLNDSTTMNIGVDSVLIDTVQQQ